MRYRSLSIGLIRYRADNHVRGRSRRQFAAGAFSLLRHISLAFRVLRLSSSKPDLRINQRHVYQVLRKEPHL